MSAAKKLHVCYSHVRSISSLSCPATGLYGHFSYSYKMPADIGSRGFEAIPVFCDGFYRIYLCVPAFGFRFHKARIGCAQREMARTMSFSNRRVPLSRVCRNAEDTARSQGHRSKGERRRTAGHTLKNKCIQDLKGRGCRGRRCPLTGYRTIASDRTAWYSTEPTAWFDEHDSIVG